MLLQPHSRLRDHWRDQATNLFAGSKIIPRIQSRNEWERLNGLVSPREHCKEILDKVGENLRKHYQNTNYVAVDEWVPFYKGRNPWGVWMSSKPAGQGFKVYVAADSNAMPLNLRLYQGSGSSMYDVVVDVESKIEVGGKLVIVVDSYFGSEKLANELNRRGRRFIMAIKSNSSLSKNYKAMASAEIERGVAGM